MQYHAHKTACKINPDTNLRAISVLHHFLLVQEFVGIAADCRRYHVRQLSGYNDECLGR